MFRRIIIETAKLTYDDLNSYLNSDIIRLKYNDINILLKVGLKLNVFIIDLRGDGGDGLSKKLKQHFQPYCEKKIQIKKEIKLIPKN
jgi:hypothetical protein